MILKDFYLVNWPRILAIDDKLKKELNFLGENAVIRFSLKLR